MSCAVLGQTQAECPKIDFFFFVLPLSGAAQMGFHFAQEQCVKANYALGAVLTLYC